jgi:hypothetical protein
MSGRGSFCNAYDLSCVAYLFVPMTFHICNWSRICSCTIHPSQRPRWSCLHDVELFNSTTYPCLSPPCYCLSLPLLNLTAAFAAFSFFTSFSSLSPSTYLHLFYFRSSPPPLFYIFFTSYLPTSPLSHTWTFPVFPYPIIQYLPSTPLSSTQLLLSLYSKASAQLRTVFIFAQIRA